MGIFLWPILVTNEYQKYLWKKKTWQIYKIWYNINPTVKVFESFGLAPSLCPPSDYVSNYFYNYISAFRQQLNFYFRPHDSLCSFMGMEFHHVPLVFHITMFHMSYKIWGLLNYWPPCRSWWWNDHCTLVDMGMHYILYILLFC